MEFDRLSTAPLVPRQSKNRQHTSAFSSPTLRQDHPHLDLSFRSFLDFFAPWYGKSKGASCMKNAQKNSMESLSKVPPKLLACLGFIYKVVHKTGRLRKFNRSREIEFNFFTAWTIAMKSCPLVLRAPYTTLPHIFIFAQGLVMVFQSRQIGLRL